MVMVCRDCGAEIPEDSSFCPRCGKATQEGPQPFVQDAVWEYCQIEKQGFSRFERGGITQRTWFSAEAIGPRGTHSAGESRGLYYARLQQVINRVRGDEEEVLQGLVDKLLAEGWEKLPEQGEEWYQLRFRRRLA
jgi:hypothetical protein